METCVIKTSAGTFFSSNTYNCTCTDHLVVKQPNNCPRRLRYIKYSDEMNAKQGARSYVDFEPSFEWSRGEETDILRVYLPGFKREYIKVQVDGYGNLRTTGERPLEGNRWSRFWKDFRLPANCNVSSIRAKFEDETLIITLPKEIVQSKPTAPGQLPNPSKPVSAPLKPASASETPKPAAPEPKPAADQASVPSQKNEPTIRTLGEMLRAEKEEKVDDMAKVTAAQPVSDKKETDKKEEKLVEEKKPDKQLITEAIGAGVDARSAEDPAQAYGVTTGLQRRRWGLLLNVAVALMVLVGIGIFWSFKLKGVADGDHQHNSEEL